MYVIITHIIFILAPVNGCCFDYLAQLVERCIHIAEVAGSSPAVVTNLCYNNSMDQDIIKKIFKGTIELIKTLATVFIIAFLLKTLVVQTFIVEGQSMEKAFHTGEYLLIDKISYRMTSPKRGDIIVFIPRDDPDKSYIKRVIGLPGEKLKIEPSRININDRIIDESSYLGNFVGGITKADEKYSVNLNDNEYFVMGDNRDNSRDSRVIGPIHKEQITGRAFIVLYPINNFGLVKLPSYSAVAATR